MRELGLTRTAWSASSKRPHPSWESLETSTHQPPQPERSFLKGFGEADAYCEGLRLCYSGLVKRKCNLLGHDMVVLHAFASFVQEL
jgi:hypothetical protein